MKTELPPYRVQHITAPSKRRAGKLMQAVQFIVVHDTGNPGSTAAGNAMYYERTREEMHASAHLFVDDREIIETVPLNEKAWHVMYAPTIDNELFGCDANDAAIGVEWCYGNNVDGVAYKRDIDGQTSYKHLIALLAMLCQRYNLAPTKHMVGHYRLDPDRKTDPVTGLQTIGKTFADVLSDTANALNNAKEKKTP